MKRNAIAGHRFESWAALEAHLSWWMREIADVRDHGTTEEPPIERFRRAEAAALRPLDGRPPFRQVRELRRRVQADCSIELDANSYSAPWRLIGETVELVVAGGRVSIRHAGREVAVHPETTGRDSGDSAIIKNNRLDMAESDAATRIVDRAFDLAEALG